MYILFTVKFGRRNTVQIFILRFQSGSRWWKQLCFRFPFFSMFSTLFILLFCTRIGPFSNAKIDSAFQASSFSTVDKLAVEFFVGSILNFDLPHFDSFWCSSVIHSGNIEKFLENNLKNLVSYRIFLIQGTYVLCYKMCAFV